MSVVVVAKLYRVIRVDLFNKTGGRGGGEGSGGSWNIRHGRYGGHCYGGHGLKVERSCRVMKRVIGRGNC